MAEDELNRILVKTLEDFRVSRGEKRVLKAVLQELDADEHRRALIRSQAFDIAREQLLSPEGKGVLDWLEDVVKILQINPAAKAESGGEEARAFFSPGDDCPRQIVNLLRRVRRSADICVFTITDDRISDAIADAHQRRIAVRIITDNDKSADLGSDVERLRRGGVPVRVDQTDYHMHHKFALFDRRTLLTGSYNWTRSAAQLNEENFVVTEDTGLARRFAQVFDDLWQKLENE